MNVNNSQRPLQTSPDMGEKLIESDCKGASALVPNRPIIEYRKMQARFEQQMSPYCNQINSVLHRS
ncbi:hypothetical protein SAMD00079811_59560 [Scytonema sp. HK-05]|uniref:hypothetical protein n=1 Tax=Scytonema sp. HK-05 TaxID=1137095 RepID=UPI0009370176|nr:hypothetical protein [Scytonema sp. HK-05]OKH51958.1 hypothetical protein NIES2130_32760 [Scytonema sp. HK-05]BAY48335.1 hypothetical protein SAMD00079811_59560 [Scytonema sp. HK-05]